jgi:hypothetical protein
MKRKAQYSVTHTQIKTFTASSGTQQISINNAFLGPVPDRILIALVKHAAFVGSASTIPFHFHHYMTNLVLYVNGVQHSSEPLTMDCSSPLELQELTKHYFQVLVFITMIVLHMITLEMFTNGFYILGFDLTPGREADEEHISLPRQANLRIETYFKKPLPEPVQCILRAEFPEHVEIDYSRNVTVE